MRGIKILVTVLLVFQVASFAQTGPYVQPLPYRHYSLPFYINIGNGILKKTDTSAYLEIGPFNGGSKGFLPPRLTNSERANIPVPKNGLQIFNKTTVQPEWYDSAAATWRAFGSSVRFAYPGEDETATGNRTFTLGGYTFRFANGICKIDSTAIFGEQDENPISGSVIAINSRTTAESFIKAWQTDVNVMRYDFRINGDVYYSGVQVYEQANTRLQAPNASFSTKVITPLISNSQGANDLLSMAPSTSDGRVGIGVTPGSDNLTDKLQLKGGFYADVTGKRVVIIGLGHTSAPDSVLAKTAGSDSLKWTAVSAIGGGGGGGDAGRLVKTLTVDANSTGNEGPGEDNLMAYTIPADTLNTNGDHIEFTMAFTFAANTNGKRVRLYYGSTVIYDSGTQNQNSGSMEIRGTIVRTGAATQLISFTQNNDAALFPIRSGYTTAAETLSSTVVLKATAEAVDDNDIRQILLIVKMFPNS